MLVKLFLVFSAAPSVLFLLVLREAERAEGWGAWAAAVALRPVIWLSVGLGVAGVALCWRRYRRREPLAGAVVGTALGGWIGAWHGLWLLFA